MASTSRSAASMLSKSVLGSSRALRASARPVVATPWTTATRTLTSATGQGRVRDMTAQPWLQTSKTALQGRMLPTLLWRKQTYATQAYLDAKPLSHAKPSSSSAASPSSSTTPTNSSASSSSSSNTEQDSSGADPEEPPPNSGIRARLRFLMRRYGWWALAVYMLASFFDFGLVFASIHLLGADHIRELEEKVRDRLGMGKREMEDEEAAVWPVPLGALLGDDDASNKSSGKLKGNNAEDAKAALARIHPTSENNKKEDVVAGEAAAVAAAAASPSSTTKAKGRGGSGGSGTLWTEAVLAYTIHKTLLLPFRVGITAAFTPRFVKWMVKMGWARNNQAVHQAASKAKAARDARKAAAAPSA